MHPDDLRGTWVTLHDGEPAALRVRKCQLRVLEGPDAGASFEFVTPTIRVGGRDTADLALHDPKVSGVHFEISLGDDGYRLRDLQSTNGTYVRGMRVSEVFIASGATVYVGDSKLQFVALSDSVERPLSAAHQFGGLIGRSPIMRELFARLERMAATDVTVLLAGETGTGKDLTAEAIHDHSARQNQPLVVVDCGSIQPNLIESELFGHEKGAFTGATAPHTGAFERAHTGTLFLDEIGELPLSMQPKLLRVLERREIRRLGGQKMMKVDARVIAATNRDLAVEVNKGQFREDLYYRLAVVTLEVPPLRERREDIPELTRHLLGIIPGGNDVELSSDTMDLMLRHDWPGNVRELRNVLERAASLNEVPSNTASLQRGPARRVAQSSNETTSANIDVPFKQAKKQLVDEFEREYVRQALERYGGNVSAAARASGVDRMVIHKIAERFGLRNRG